METITDHEFKHGCMQNCPLDHSHNTCEHRDADCNRCGKTGLVHGAKLTPVTTIGSLTPINGTYFESQGLIDDETPDVEEPESI